MKKILGFLTLASLAVGLVVSCGSTSGSKGSTAPAPVDTRPAYRLISNQNSDFGGSIPNWVTASISSLEGSDEYKDKYVFKFEGTGSNLEGTKLKVNNLNAAGEMARFISMRVQALFAGAQVGDDKNLETYMENVVKSLAQTTLSGFRKVDDFWIQRQYFDDNRTEYVYRVLYTIDQTKVKELLGQAAGAAADTPEKQTAKSRVLEIMQGGLPALSE
jgi:hypothetical protein